MEQLIYILVGALFTAIAAYLLFHLQERVRWRRRISNMLYALQAEVTLNENAAQGLSQISFDKTLADFQQIKIPRYDGIKTILFNAELHDFLYDKKIKGTRGIDAAGIYAQTTANFANSIPWLKEGIALDYDRPLKDIVRHSDLGPFRDATAKLQVGSDKFSSQLGNLRCQVKQPYRHFLTKIGNRFKPFWSRTKQDILNAMSSIEKAVKGPRNSKRVDDAKR